MPCIRLRGCSWIMDSSRSDPQQCSPHLQYLFHSSVRTGVQSRSVWLRIPLGRRRAFLKNHDESGGVVRCTSTRAFYANCTETREFAHGPLSPSELLCVDLRGLDSTRRLTRPTQNVESWAECTLLCITVG